MPSSEAMLAARTLLRRLALVVGATLLSLPAPAADKDAKDPTRRLQQQLRKAEQDKAQLLLQKTAAEAQLKEAQDKAAETERQGRQRNARLAREIEALKAQFGSLAESSKAEQAALGSKLADSERRLAESRREKLQLDAAFAKQRTTLATCTERNLAMHKLGNEVLDRYEEKGCLTSVLQAEPFTQLQRAKIENLIEDYRDKLDSQKFEAPSPSAVPAGSARR